MISRARLETAYQTALAALLQERTPDGHWVGELSTSALSTATAVMALHLVGRPDHRPLVDGGLAWLAAHQNADGGWGDTTISLSNISTTMLCRAAFYLAKPAGEQREPAGSGTLTPGPSPGGRGEPIARAESWLSTHYGPAEKWPEAIRQRYGKDRTFATPILTTCALAGLVSWDEVPPLPFELSVLPQSWFRFVRLHVVSYALPALIAIGQCIYHHRKPRNPLTRAMRALSRKRSLRVLESIQPSSGGFLEATPLTSFVTLSLAASGLADHPVTQNGVRFLVNSVRPDGSWPIDSNLATWVTTLSVNALAAAGELPNVVKDRGLELVQWLLGQQFRERHPYTGADPWAWAWTPLPGGVPDADDTAGAFMALRHLDQLCDPDVSAGVHGAIINALPWLLDLQNRDGGWPTFCRGWGRLPFDRSGADLTAHAVRAIRYWSRVEPDQRDPGRNCLVFRFRARDIHQQVAEITIVGGRSEPAVHYGLEYLRKHQRSDGSWLPLWFGNQHMPDDENPTYGTARVLAAYRDLSMMDTEPARKGIAWLLANQNPDGGWGGGRGSPSSIEESALAIDILVDAGPDAQAAVNSGVAWLVDQVVRGRLLKPTPIGFYFAKLWYFEKLYPIIFTVSALGRLRKNIRNA